MTKLGKLWTAGIAYVSLLVGAGLSVAGNLADTYRTRGADIDNLDKVMAAGWPILVLLAIEMFVSPRWSPARMFQAWRWIGCLAVGGMAMVVSWTHLHDLMASRGQLYIVSVLGPLAIDGMAIMATGLILSTRVRGHLPDTDIRQRVAMTAPDVATFKEKMSAAMSGHTAATPAGWTGPVATDKDVADSEAAFYGRDRWADLVSTDTDLVSWADGHDRAVTDMGQELATEAERYVRGIMSADTLPTRTRTPSGMSAPEEFVSMAAAWDPIELERADMVKLSAAYFDVSTRTARRWLSAVTGTPMSGAPEQS